MRLLISADIHLGSPIRSAALRNPELGERLKQASRDTFTGLVDLAIVEQVDALVLAGDIFDNDHPDLKSRAFLIAQLSRAAEAGVPTVLIRGNHDALLDHRAHGELGPNIHLLHKGTPTVEIAGVAFHGLSFDAAHETKSFLPDYPVPVPGKRNVGLMHTSLDGAAGHDPYAPCSSKDLMANGYDLWCLGHIHAPFEKVSGPVLAVMPGIPQPRHFGERSGGTVTMVTLADGPPEFQRHDIGRMGFAECALDLTECTNQQEVLRSLLDGLRAARVDGRDTAVRLQVISDRFATEMISELAGELLENIDGVYLDKVKVVAPPAKPGAVPDDLVRLMQEELDESGFRLAASEMLEDLRLALPAEIADELDEDHLDSLLAEAIAEVSKTLHARGAE
ncbi:metallophosphoesterase family protein [Flavimaricola marinus]|uniref:Putative metallophosphoesterase YhaO n=1 Tax=Flavimaricola marinus TaxID=1819565 RepID=A0A238LJ36_9RHOB|nr:metallophosphoesterase [Flavimaricola marinus]SMY09424.1 putative metallophosphoesterase YhaO [Flavimaricola marinus]